LVVAEKELTEAEYAEWQAARKTAEEDLENQVRLPLICSLAAHVLLPFCPLCRLTVRSTHRWRTLCSSFAQSFSPSLLFGTRIVFTVCSSLAHLFVALWHQDRLLAEAAASIERGMSFVGVTAIEDKLQEGVPRAIANLRKANKTANERVKELEGQLATMEVRGGGKDRREGGE